MPVVRLAEGVPDKPPPSRIIINAHRINQGAMPGSQRACLARGDFYFVPADDPEVAVQAHPWRLVKSSHPQTLHDLNPIRDIQVLCPMNRGGVGARSLNIELQAATEPTAGERKVERFGWTFAPGDKVMQIENDYDKEVYNGDNIGYIVDVDPRRRPNPRGRASTRAVGDLRLRRARHAGFPPMPPPSTRARAPKNIPQHVVIPGPDPALH